MEILDFEGYDEGQLPHKQSRVVRVALNPRENTLAQLLRTKLQHLKKHSIGGSEFMNLQQ